MYVIAKYESIYRAVRRNQLILRKRKSKSIIKSNALFALKNELHSSYKYTFVQPFLPDKVCKHFKKTCKIIYTIIFYFTIIVIRLFDVSIRKSIMLCNNVNINNFNLVPPL